MAVVAFANNQSLTAIGGTDSVITTDPVPLGDNDRASAMFSVHALWQTGGITTLTYQAQVSNDGVHYVNVTALTDSASATTGSTPKQKVESVNGAYIRFVFTLSNDTANQTCGVCFDLHVKLDHV